MRRLVFVVCAVFAAISVVSFSTLTAKAQSSDQYGSSDGAEASSNPTESTAPGDEQPGADFISQGLVTGERSAAAAKAVREDLAEEEQLPDYSQVVGNTTKGAFSAPGWKVQRGSLSHEGSFVAAEGAKAPARFGVKIPSSNDYSVYAWWPEAAKSGTARYGVQTASGTKWSEVEQVADSSGMWIKLGTYAMEEGQRYVQVTAGSGDGDQVVADAVAVVRGEAVAPPDDEAVSPSASGEQRAASNSRGRSTGRDVVRQSRRHLGTKYGSSPCRINAREDCSCHTKLVFKKFGYNLPDHPGRQWKYGRKIAKSNLRPGDLVFFDDTRNGSIRDAHDGVGIYSGNGRYISGNSYFGRVVEKEMKWRKGYFGAKRLRLR